MTKLSCAPLWKENNKWEIVGLCYILSMTNLRSELGGLRWMGSPPLCGLARYIRLGEPTYGFLDPILGWANLPMVFGPWFWTRWFSVHGIGCSACINMYCNIERNIMKNQAGSPGFEIQWEISVYTCFTCYALAFLIFL